MSVNPEEVQRLRNEIARLITRNLELERQLEDLRREKAELGVEAVAASLVHSLEATDEALAAATDDQSYRYTVTELQATVRAGVAQRQGRLLVHFPRAELPLVPAALSSVQLTVARQPRLPGALAPAITPAQALTVALEEAQLVFANWGARTGASAARALTGALTRLLSERRDWAEPGALEAFPAVSQAASQLASALRRQRPAAAVAPAREAITELRELLRPLLAARAATDDLGRLAAVLQRLTRSLRAILD